MFGLSVFFVGFLKAAGSPSSHFVRALLSRDLGFDCLPEMRAVNIEVLARLFTSTALGIRSPY